MSENGWSDASVVSFCPDFGCRGLPWVLTSLGFGGSSYVLAVVLVLPGGYPGWMGYGLICWLWSPLWGGDGCMAYAYRILLTSIVGSVRRFDLLISWVHGK